MGVVNKAPLRLQQRIYALSGGIESVATDKLASADVERIAQWVVAQYPQQRDPAVAIGSSNGVLVHLCAALGIPWLPQTFLVPVGRLNVRPDEPDAGAAWAEQPAQTFLARNRNVQLHHMHDPNQDRLTIQRLAYFRASGSRFHRPIGIFCASAWRRVERS